MSYAGPPNPYASPTAPPVAIQPAAMPFKPIERFEYMRMYQYVFENPNWMMNVLLSALCLLIPVVGPVVVIGYQYEVVLGLLATHGQSYPSFNFDRFADYLMRGVWPFLVQLVASLVLTPVILVLVFVPMLVMSGVAGAAGDDAGPIILGVGLLIIMLVLIAVSMLLTVVMLPMMMRSALAQDFVEGFKFDWVMDFFKKLWKELLVAMLFVGATGFVLALLGMLACYVGMFATMPLVFLAQAHMIYQAYVMFLTRGGSPVPVKMSGPMAMPPGKPL